MRPRHTARRILAATAVALAVVAILLGGGRVGRAATPATVVAPAASLSAPAAAPNPIHATDVVAQTVAVTTRTTALRWDKPEYTITAGDITFVVRNPSPLRRTFIVAGNAIVVPSITLEGGETKLYTLRGLAPGQYQIVDNIGGYAKAGAVATLLVK